MYKIFEMLAKLSVAVFGFVLTGQVLRGVVSHRYDSSQCETPCVPGSEAIMSPKAHGTSDTPVQSNLRWNCDWDTADRICNFNRHYAEYSGYWETTTFSSDIDTTTTTKFYDSNTEKLLFTAPVNRSWDDFLQESRHHGWPSFRDDEVNWENVRVLPDGETVSVDGTHLGHNIPDSKGRRYCINIVSIAGKGTESSGRRDL